MSPTHERTPDWLLERIALGELPPDELERARARLLAEPDGAARLAALERSNRDILAALPPERVAAEVQRRLHLKQVQEGHRAGQRSSRFSPRWMALPVAAALAVLVFVSSRGVATGDGPDGDDRFAEVLGATGYSGIKGEAQLHVHRQVGDTAEKLERNARARTGDTLQLSYTAAGAQYGVVVSVDGRRMVTVHLPVQGPQAARLEQKGAVSLSNAYELDDAPAFERFFLVTSARPFAVATVVQAAERLAASDDARDGALALPSSLKQTAFLVEKATR
jgi:hypothetical protein